MGVGRGLQFSLLVLCVSFLSRDTGGELASHNLRLSVPYCMSLHGCSYPVQGHVAKGGLKGQDAQRPSGATLFLSVISHSCFFVFAFCFFTFCENCNRELSPEATCRAV